MHISNLSVRQKTDNNLPCFHQGSEMQSINSFRFCFILFLILLFSGCATPMKMAPVDLQNLTPNEGVVVGSLIVKGGKDLIGRTKWELSTENLSDSSTFSKIYSITANRDEGEKIFVSKMPAGDYSFSDLTQPFSTFHAKTYLPFTVQPNKTVYIGRIIIEFQPGFINISTHGEPSTGVDIKVEDAREDIMASVGNQYGISLKNVETGLVLTKQLAEDTVLFKQRAKHPYSSPDGGYTVTPPPLVKPGARFEERQISPVTHVVIFADDFGKVYYILRTDNTKTKFTLEKVPNDFKAGDLLREKQYTTTERGKELRILGINKNGSPVVTRSKENGEWVERKNDLYEAWSLFIHGDHIYQVTAGVTALQKESENVLFDRAKRNLEEFLKGLSIKPTKQE